MRHRRVGHPRCGPVLDPIGGQVRGYDPDSRFNRQQQALYDRFTQFTLVAAEEAIAQSGLEFSGQLAGEAGVVLGTSGGGLNTQDENYRAVYEEGKNRVHPFHRAQADEQCRRQPRFDEFQPERVRRSPWPLPVRRRTTPWARPSG